MTAIFKREVRSSFHGMIGYVLTAFMLAATAIYFSCPESGLWPDGFWLLYDVPHQVFVLLLYIPVLTMRSFAEERRTRTDQLLLTSPVSVWGHRAGQILCPVCHLCTAVPCGCGHDPCTGCTGCHPALPTLANLAALLCYFLMGCAAIAIGVFLSSLTENQIIAAVAGVAAAAAGLYDAQPAQPVHCRQRGGVGPVHRDRGSAQCGGWPAHPQLSRWAA